MSRARAEFLERLRAFAQAVQMPLLASSGPNPLKDPVRLLRNGLMVVGFATLEDFIRSRSAEVLSAVRGRVTRFEDLPPQLQSIVTENALRAAPGLLSIWKRDGVLLDEVQSLGRALASTAGTPYSLSPLGLFSQRNVSVDDIGTALGGFGVPDGWVQVSHFAGRCGLPSIGLRDHYRNAHDRRNLAAHRGSANVSQGDLQSFVMPTLAIAAGYDALLSRAGRLLQDGTITAASRITVAAKSIGLRFVERVSSGWQERTESGVVVAIDTRLATVLRGARANARPSHDLVVVQPRDRMRVEWESTDLG